MSKTSQRKKAAFAEGYAAYKIDKDTHWKPYLNWWLFTVVGREYKRGYDEAKQDKAKNKTILNRFRVFFGMANL
jgi:hypothetical protein